MTAARQDTDRRCALVTGASRRIGRAIALRLAEEGWDVAIHYNRSETEARQVAQEVEARGQRSITLAADLGDPSVAGQLVRSTNDRLGPLGLLVNNANHFGKDSLATLTLQSWRHIMEVNLTSQVFLMQAFAQQRSVPGGASIINLLDQQMSAPSPAFFSYFVAKFGLEGATQVAAFDLAPAIRVNAIAPGLVLPSAAQSETAFRTRQGMMPLGSGLAPGDIADAVIYLAGARHVTGQVICVDSGQRLRGMGNSELGPSVSHR
jgi:NAD(P)-dependent dehydrogenase (short-subunit alcohol dehydrogenase family)